jgi:hypothetical protein
MLCREWMVASPELSRLVIEQGQRNILDLGFTIPTMASIHIPGKELAFWSRLWWLDMTTYERSTLDER